MHSIIHVMCVNKGVRWRGIRTETNKCVCAWILLLPPTSEFLSRWSTCTVNTRLHSSCDLASSLIWSGQDGKAAQGAPQALGWSQGGEERCGKGRGQERCQGVQPEGECVCCPVVGNCRSIGALSAPTAPTAPNRWMVICLTNTVGIHQHVVPICGPSGAEDRGEGPKTSSRPAGEPEPG
jgi:hypothetical protein